MWLNNHRAFTRVFACGVVGLVTASHAAPTYYYGFDAGGANPRLLGHPNAIAAQTAFLGALPGSATQTFDALATGDVWPRTVSFPGSTTTAIITKANNEAVPNTGIVSLPSGDSFGAFPISGSQLLITGSSVNLAFSSPQSSFGVFIIDPLEVGSQLAFQFFSHGALVDTWNTPTSGSQPNGSVAYFGVKGEPLFDSVTMLGAYGGWYSGETIAYDDITITTPEPGTATLLIAASSVLIMLRTVRNTAQ